jgi:hypothetical protein
MNAIAKWIFTFVTSATTPASEAPSHPVRNRLIRLTADSPDLLAIINQEGRE